MDNLHFVHFSNRTERLYQELKKNLFASSHPLTKRIIIVPSAAMKSWLMLQMAGDPDLGISAGMEIGFVEPTINHLFQTLSDKTTKQTDPYEPSELELALALEEAMIHIASIYQSSSMDPLPQEWLPLMHYLGVSKSEKNIQKRSLKRTRALAHSLAKLFRDYGISGGEMVADFSTNQPGWQALLWQQMESIFSEWNYPAKKLSTFQIEPSVNPHDIQVHVFGLSFLSPLHHRFLCHIAAHLPVCYYLFSPCQKFWGDTLSNKESIRLKKYWDKQGANQNNLDALDEFLRDCNPLLANFGRLGREMATQIETMDCQCTETYALPESLLSIPSYSELASPEIILEATERPLTLLEAVQSDLVLLRTIDNENKISFNDYDGTIQIHAVPKKAREVQVIYDVLLSLLDKHRDDPDPLLPSDIFVMAPKISDYAPFIRSVFESSESRLDIQVMDLQMPTQYLAVQGFLHLLTLGKGRWEASALLQLFDYAAFRKRHRLTGEDIAIIRDWVKKADIHWGKDATHREEIFKRNYQYKQTETLIGTWEHGLGRLLEGLAMIHPEEDEGTDFSPLNHIESSQSDLLGIVIHLIRSLQADLQPLMNETKLSLEDWSTYLKCLLDAYFISSTDEEGIEGYRILTGHIESFAKATKRLSESTFAFETIYYHLKESLEKETAVYKESNVQAVRFSSLLPMRAVPAKVVVLMGMDDGQFPGMDQTNTLNLLFESPNADYHPNRVDFDRYMFLESILSARQYFILSYISQVPGVAKAQSPSLLVKELASYLDHAYSINSREEIKKTSSFCSYNHPLIPFHHLYFSNDQRYKSYSRKNYQAALAYYHEDKKEQHTFISDFNPLSSQVEIEEETVNLKDLMAFSKNPLKVYVNKVLGIYLDKDEDRIVKDEGDFFLSDLNAYVLTKQGLFGSKEATLKKAKKSGLIPPGPFKEIGSQKIEKEIDQYLENFDSYDIDLQKIFSIECLEHYLEPEFSEKIWKLPPLMVDVPSIGKIKMVGRIENVCSKGLILFSEKNNDKKLLEKWPSCLFLNCLIEACNLAVEPQIIFIKGIKTGIRKIQDSQTQKPMDSLSDYLEYYLSTRKGLSPLVPDWVKLIMSGNLEGLKDVLKKNDDDRFQPITDQYDQWLKRNSPNVEMESSIAHWQPKAKKLFVNVLEKKNKKKIMSVNEGEDE